MPQDAADGHGDESIRPAPFRCHDEVWLVSVTCGSVEFLHFPLQSAVVSVTTVSTVSRVRHFSCEDCDGSVSGGFDADTSEIVLCQNNIHNQPHMDRVVTHELIHAFDHCRAHVDWFNNIRHLACSEIRAANLSGDCSLSNEISRFNFGLKQHHQACVRDRALRSILAVRQISREAAEKAVNDVFESCFNDYEPFGRIPHCARDADMAHRDFKNRGRHYANL
ncbi:mitochondrial inner membrane protease ATP23 homolog isoform X2 [Ranitomeya imitator]|uniref:mitochondrial inner membrane protease ATP23 homolog isoform X2 n=1 Tax=Ranitomeya imitator TaxID=111125 RepID=UPI0037E896F6